MNEPYLSVVFITYNHERYIRQALDSVLMQKTDFPFEIVVGEDCSTDHTRDILNEYKEKYPDQIRLLYREKNLGRPTLNVYQTAMECKGKYMAFLEGDDFWTDPEKLQKQVRFLEEHDEYEAVTIHRDWWVKTESRFPIRLRLHFIAGAETTRLRISKGSLTGPGRLHLL